MIHTPEPRSSPLPEGWTVKLDHAIGATYRDEQGRVLCQHPYDDEAGLALAKSVYARKRRERYEWEASKGEHHPIGIPEGYMSDEDIAAFASMDGIPVKRRR